MVYGASLYMEDVSSETDCSVWRTEFYYWLEDEIEEWNFKAITDETSFYLNDKGNVVIGFDEGEVAPMYMGTVEFEIPAEALQGIRK